MLGSLVAEVIVDKYTDKIQETDVDMVFIQLEDYLKLYMSSIHRDQDLMMIMMLPKHNRRAKQMVIRINIGSAVHQEQKPTQISIKDQISICASSLHERNEL